MAWTNQCYLIRAPPETCLVNPCVKFHRPHSPVLFPLCLTAFAQILPFLLELARMDVPTRASDVTSSNTSNELTATLQSLAFLYVPYVIKSSLKYNILQKSA